MTIAAIALEQITLLKAQNARLIELNARHVQQLEQLCEERDETRGKVEQAKDDYRDLFKNCSDDIRQLEQERDAARTQLKARDGVSE